jgi:acetolactate synthase I/II/III large subunit
MKLTDYLADFLAKNGVKHVFGITGGAAMHIFDSIAKNPQIEPIFCHHEQAASLAAEAYSRINLDTLGVAVVTQGPGALNTIMGLSAAWLDSVPSLFISGQARRSLSTRGKPVRQLSTQAFDVAGLVEPICKKSIFVENPENIHEYLEDAVKTALEGRPGPVWIELPLDCQWHELAPVPEIRDVRKWPGPEDDKTIPSDVISKIDTLSEMIEKAERPLIIGGWGVRLSRAHEEFKELINSTGIPFVTTWNASDILPSDHSSYVGRPGLFGQRGSNLAIQNCDLLIAFGTHIPTGVTTNALDKFAREAKIVMVNVDSVELDNTRLDVELSICSDAGQALRLLNQNLKKDNLSDQLHETGFPEWKQKCREYHEKYNFFVDREKLSDEPSKVDPYNLLDVMSKQLSSDSVICIDGGGSITQIAPQIISVKDGQRLMLGGGVCTMGSFPESIGACLGSGGKHTVFVTGDGSMQLNVQELQTISHHKFPIKVFILNNNGYLLMKRSQIDFFDREFVGSCADGGVSIPNYEKLSDAYNLPYFKIEKNSECTEVVNKVLSHDGPAVCEFFCDPEHEIYPRMGFRLTEDKIPLGAPMEDMYPFMSDEELESNMFIKSLRKK